MPRLQFEQWLPFSVERVFAFFSNPENLPLLMPAATQTRLDDLKRVPPPNASPESNDKAAGVGSVLFTSFRVLPFLPFRRRWIARITEFEWNRYFADVQDEGPFQSWRHRHEFTSASKDGRPGTTIRDVIDYEVGFGALGAIANALFVTRQLQSTFAQRQKRLPELLG